jgi:HSP20 family protein
MLARYATWLAGDDVFRPLLPLFDLAFSSPFDLDTPALEAGPKVDILEKDSGLELVCDVPGARPEDVSVTMENGILTIQARRTLDYANAAVRRAERYQGAFTRAFRLGSGYDPAQVSATLDNGVLLVRVAKRPEAMPRKIPIYFGLDAANKQLAGKAGDTSDSA